MTGRVPGGVGGFVPAGQSGRRLLVHIGLPKCGSTTIQQALGVLEPELRRRGVLLPAAGRAEAAGEPCHANLARELDGVAFEPALGGWRKLAAEICGSDASTVVLTAETLSHVGREAAAKVASVAASCGRAVEVVGYVRPQWEILESFYAQKVRTGAQRLPFDVFAAASFLRPPQRHHKLGFRRVFAPWRERFGLRVRVRPLEALREQGGLAGDFLGLLDAPELVHRDWPRANVRNGAKETEVRRLAAIQIAREGAGRARRMELMAKLGGLPQLLQPDPPFAGLDAAQAKELMALYETENAAFAREFGIEPDGVLFRKPLESAGRQPNVVHWHDLEPIERRAVRDYVRTTIGVDVERSVPRRRRAFAPSGPGTFGSRIWLAGWMRDRRFLAYLAERAAARLAGKAWQRRTVLRGSPFRLLQRGLGLGG